MKRLGYAALFGSLLLVGGCVTEHSVHVAPIQLQPIQVTMDVNVHIDDNHAAASDAGTESTSTTGGDAPRAPNDAAPSP